MTGYVFVSFFSGEPHKAIFFGEPDKVKDYFFLFCFRGAPQSEGLLFSILLREAPQSKVLLVFSGIPTK